MNELFILDECTLNDDYYYACSAINNKELYDFLYINDIIFIWGAEEDGFSFAYLLEAFDVNDEIYETQIRSNFRSNNLRNALCVK